MILVTVGTHPTMHFDRLIIPMDELAAELDEQVTIQLGCSSYKPKYAHGFPFTTSEHFDELIDNARVIVSHAASGTEIAVLKKTKPLVMVPRQHALGEHIDNHQLELATALAEQQRAVTLYEPSVAALWDAIQRAAQQQHEDASPGRLIRALHNQFNEWHLASPRFTQPVGRKT